MPNTGTGQWASPDSHRPILKVANRLSESLQQIELRMFRVSLLTSACLQTRAALRVMHGTYQSSSHRFTASGLNLTKRPALRKGSPWFRRLLTCRVLQRA
jgi:hypothetical protein